MAEIVDRVNGTDPIWNLLGYISVDSGVVGEFHNGYPVIGSAKQYAEFEQAYVIPDNKWRNAAVDPAWNLETRAIRLIDPSAVVSRTADISPGCVIYPHSFVGLNAQLGRNVFCLSGCIINHDVRLDDSVILASGVHLAGSVHVEANCYLGQSCTIKQNVTIGAGSLIGMGAVVTKDVPPRSVIIGNPGRFLRVR